MQKKARTGLVSVLTVLAIIAAPGRAGGQGFVRGDANTDGIVSIADSVGLDYHLFGAGPAPSCTVAADSNNDGKLNIVDGIKVLASLFAGDRIAPAGEEPPIGGYDCQAALTRSPALDAPAAVALDEVVAAGEEIVVPVRVLSGEYQLHAWHATVLFPPESLAVVRVDPAPGDDEDPAFNDSRVLEPGKLQLCVQYSFMMTNVLPITPGAELANIVFSPVGSPAGRVALQFMTGYGATELVFQPDDPTVFPAAIDGAAVFDTDSPAPPSGFTATAGAAEISLSWSNGAAYGAVVVERNGSVAATLPGDATSYVDPAPSGLHTYRVRGRNGTTDSVAPAAVAALWTLAPPLDFAIEQSGAGTVLTWQNGAEYRSIEVYRNGTLIADIGGYATSYTDAGAALGVLVYHVRGASGDGRSMHVSAFPTTGDPFEFGENAVTNLSCGFAAPGEFVLSWDRAPAGNGYEVVRSGTTLASLPLDATGLVDHPTFEQHVLIYEVRTVQGGAMVARKACTLGYRPLQSVANLQATTSPDRSSARLTWENRSDYIGITVAMDGQEVAVLSGGATSHDRDIAFGDSPVIEFVVTAIGADYVTAPVVAYVEDPSRRSPFLRGDANWNGRVSTADALFLRRHLFTTGGVVPPCKDAADTNDDGDVNVADEIKILGGIYSAGVIFPEPYPIPAFDPTGDLLACEAGEPEDGAFTEDVIRVGSIEAAPGQDVKIAIYITNLVPIEAFQVVIRYDPAVISIEENPFDSIDMSGTAFERLYGDRKAAFTRAYAPPGEGYFVAGGIWSIMQDMPLPAGNDQLLARVNARVAATATPGTTIKLVPINGPENEGVGIHRLLNEITSTGESRYVSLYPRTEKGFIAIKDNPMTLDFLRADVNLDSIVNIADPLFTLRYLFSTGPAPACLDAADANDDGVLGLADAIVMLGYLFSQETPAGLPAAFGICGIDGTADTLGGCHYGYCR